MPSKFEIGGNPVDIESLPRREATDLERRKMLGSIATFYELKVPIIYCAEAGKFYPIDYQESIGEFNSGRELVILQSTRILPSIFSKVRKKPRQMWR